MSLNFYCESEEKNNGEESINDHQNIFSICENNPPSLSEALAQMFNSYKLDKNKVNELIEDILKKSEERIKPEFEVIKKKYGNITNEDAYIISSYTCESKEYKYSPYRILNQNLVSVDLKNSINNISKYLYIFLKDLRKSQDIIQKINIYTDV